MEASIGQPCDYLLFNYGDTLSSLRFEQLSVQHTRSFS
jgi:hypothetical protein